MSSSSVKRRRYEEGVEENEEGVRRQGNAEGSGIGKNLNANNDVAKK